jgi:hypothetical protein
MLAIVQRDAFKFHASGTTAQSTCGLEQGNLRSLLRQSYRCGTTGPAGTDDRHFVPVFH